MLEERDFLTVALHTVTKTFLLSTEAHQYTHQWWRPISHRIVAAHPITLSRCAPHMGCHIVKLACKHAPERT